MPDVRADCGIRLGARNVTEWHREPPSPTQAPPGRRLRAVLWAQLGDELGGKVTLGEKVDLKFREERLEHRQLPEVTAQSRR